jgi:hypothetical protein
VTHLFSDTKIKSDNVIELTKIISPWNPLEFQPLDVRLSLTRELCCVRAHDMLFHAHSKRSNQFAFISLQRFLPNLWSWWNARSARVEDQRKERSLEHTHSVYIQRDKNLIIARRARVDVDHCGKSDRVICVLPVASLSPRRK